MIVLSGRATLREVVSVADGLEPVAVEASVYEALRVAHDAAGRLSARHPTYGRTTGVGANRLNPVAPTDDSFGLRLLRSHAVDAGPSLPSRTVRAMLAVRLNQLCIPGGGLDPAVPEGLVRMLNQDALPEVRQFSSIGTGDLAALAGTALTLMGERPASRPLAPMPPWTAASALPFMSSSALTIARGCLVTVELGLLERASRMIFGLTFAALNGNPAAISPLAAAAAVSPGVVEIADDLAVILRSDTRPDRTPARIQDPYGLRVYAITQGGVLTALNRLTGQLTRLLNAGQENPLFDFDGNTVLHHGAFFQAALALAFDAATLALSQASTITHSRIRLLNEPAYNGARAFLADDLDGSSGLMMVEYVSAAAVAEMRAAAHPASLGSLVLSRGAEEDASFAAQGVLQLERACSAYRTLLASELLGAIRLARESDLTRQLIGPLGAMVALADGLSGDVGDRDLRRDVEVAGSLLDALGALDQG